MQHYQDKIETSGTGLWSKKKKTVTVIGYTVPYTNDECDFGELRVMFDTDTWDTDADGLIYTDPAFLASVREAFATDDIEYSEAGMQGFDYVSFDVGSEFLSMYEGA